MEGRPTKKQLIIESAAELGAVRVGPAELRRVQHRLRQQIAPGKPPSLGYVASVLRDSGIQVDYEDRYTDPVIPERYASRLEGVLKFDDLAAAEAALRSLDSAYREYESGSDHAGALLVRKLVLRGRERAERLASNARIRPEKRQEKAEIASWFRVWLGSPALFFDWLELRRQTEEFRQLFRATSEAPPDENQGQTIIKENPEA